MYVRVYECAFSSTFLGQLLYKVRLYTGRAFHFPGLIVEFSQAPLERSLMSLEIRLGAFNEVEIC